MTGNEHSKYTLPRLEVVEVSDDTKQLLLQDPVRSSRSRTLETKEIFSRLRRLHPTTSEAFALKESGVTKAPFRLICEASSNTRKNHLHRHRSFIALSYCWHSEAWQPAEGLRVHKDDLMTWPISLTMLEMILSLRLTSSEGIWIDSLCIDQQNADEKSLAIGSMDAIYQRARLVCIVLEDVLLTSRERTIIESLTRRPEGHKSHETLGGVDPALAVLTFVKIMSARWFTRAWCSHEVQMCKQCIILIPAKSGVLQLRLDSIHDLYLTAQSLAANSEELGRHILGVSRSYDAISRVQSREHTKVPSHWFARPFMSIFHDICELSCTNAEDKISIALNVTGIRLRYLKNSVSEDESRWTLAMIALAGEDATSMCGVAKPLVIDQKKSWLAWSDDLEDMATLNAAAKLAKEPCIAKIEYSNITLDLLLVDKEKTRYPKADCWRKAEAFVAQCFSNQHFLDSVKPKEWAADAEGDVEVYKERQTALLASSLSCGTAWMILNGMMIQQLVGKLKRRVDDEKFDLWSVACTTFFDKTSMAFQHACVDSNEREMLEDFLLWAWHYPLDFEGQITCVDLGNGGSALGPWFSDQRTDLGEAVWAIPVALSDSYCATIRRLWLLETAGDGVWRMVAKSRFFTYIPVEANGDSIRLLSDQIIFGEA